MHVAALDLDLHLPACRSLKAKRAVVKPLTERLHRRHGVAVSEVGDQDRWQRARLGVAVVAPTSSRLDAILDDVERTVWSVIELEVLAAERHWLEIDR